MSTPSTALPSHSRHTHYVYPHSHSHLYPVSTEAAAGTVAATQSIPSNVVTATASSTLPSAAIPPALTPSGASSVNTVNVGAPAVTLQTNNLSTTGIPSSLSLAPVSIPISTFVPSNSDTPTTASTFAAYREIGGVQGYPQSNLTGHEGLVTSTYSYSPSSSSGTSLATQHTQHSAPVSDYNQNNQRSQALQSVSSSLAVNGVSRTATSSSRPYYPPTTEPSIATHIYGQGSYHLPAPNGATATAIGSATIPSISSVLGPSRRTSTAEMIGMATGMSNPPGGVVHAGHGHGQDHQLTSINASPMVMSTSSGQASSGQYQVQSQSTPVSQPTSMPQTPRRRRRKEGGPDWNEFYKNGPPEEIIVIVDDDDVPPSAENVNSGPTTTTYSNQIQRQSGPPHSAKRRRTGDEGLFEVDLHNQPSWSGNPASQYQHEAPQTSIPMPIAVVDGPAGQAPRRSAGRARGNANGAARAAATANNSSSQHGGAQQPTRRAANVPQATATASSATGRSTTRTAGPTTTPLTPANFEAEPMGQKRKRQTRKTVRDEQRRLEMEATQALQAAGGIMDYIPPAKPPFKAAEVKVHVIPDTSGRGRVDDTDGHYCVEEGAEIANRFKIIKLLGQGTFGKVVEAEDCKDAGRRHYAIKIIRAVQKYRDASKIELRVLQTLKQNDKTNRNRCIHLRECFDYKGHICIVTDLLATSVFDFLKNNGFTPFPSSHIQAFAKQLFTSVAYLHDLNLIHTDLKPENILLVDEDYQTFTYQRTIPSSTTTTNRRASQRKVLIKPEIRLIDFGSATFDDEYHSSVVSTRHYRAPEIILNLGWSFPCDIWSIGCILVEFYTGDALFQTHDNLEHLAMMEAVCGYKIDTRLARQAVQKTVNGQQNGAAKYFTKNRLDYPNSETSRASKKFVKAMKRLDEIFPPTSNFNRQFLDLLRRIFIYDPAKRITAKEALQHPWFREQTLDDGTEAVKIGIQRRHTQLMKETEERAAAEASRAALRRAAASSNQFIPASAPLTQPTPRPLNP